MVAGVDADDSRACVDANLPFSCLNCRSLLRKDQDETTEGVVAEGVDIGMTNIINCCWSS